VSFDDWILALHLLSAFALIGALVMFSIAVVAVRGTDLPARAVAIMPVVKIGNIAIAVGIIGTIVFGVWLAISLDRYSIFDLWIILAIVLWAIGTETGRRGGGEYDRALARAAELTAAGKGDEPSAEFAAAIRSGRAGMFHTVAVVAMLLVVVDMIWKPGA
jgi:hypothetical protein